MSTWYEHPRKRSLYCSSDFGRAQETERTSQQDELHNSDTLSTEVTRDDMSPRPTPSPSADSLYTLPSPQTLRRVAQLGSVSHYTSLRDVPPLSLNDANDPEAHRGTHQTLLPPPPHPSSHRYHTNQRPAVLTPSPDPLLRGSLRVVNRDPSPLIASSSTQTVGHSGTRLNETSTRAKVDFTDSFVGKYEQPKVGLQAQSSEKRKVNAELYGFTQKLESGFKAGQEQNKEGPLLTTYKSWCTVHYLYDTCLSEAQKREGSKYLCSQPSITNGQSASTKTPVVSDIPPPGKVWAGTIRLPDCHSCTNNWGIRHLHDMEDEHHQEKLKIQATYQAARQKAEEKLQRKLRRQTQSRSWWPGPTGRTPLIVRSSMTTPMEDMQMTRRDLSMPALPKIEPKAVDSHGKSDMPLVRTVANLAPPKVDSKAKPMSETAAGPTAECKTPPLSADIVRPSDEGVSVLDAPTKTVPSPQMFHRSPKTAVQQNVERIKLRIQAKKIIAAQQQADEDAQWDNIDLSDDEEWDEVAADENTEWEMLEK